MGRTANHYGKTQRAKNEKTIVKFLYDEGPHTVEQLHEEIGLSRSYTAMLLNSLLNDGTIEKARLIRSSQRYFYLVP